MRRGVSLRACSAAFGMTQAGVAGALSALPQPFGVVASTLAYMTGSAIIGDYVSAGGNFDGSYPLPREVAAGPGLTDSDGSPFRNPHFDRSDYYPFLDTLVNAGRISPSGLPPGILGDDGRLPSYADYLTTTAYNERRDLDNSIEELLESQGIDLDSYARNLNGEVDQYIWATGLGTDSFGPVVFRSQGASTW